ncbi:tetratricopeptide repeat protein [bacterium]|nr:MAG: tetratricopeptide repeat protein [bacterium]
MKNKTLRLCLSASLLLSSACGTQAFAAPKLGDASPRQAPMATVQTLLGAATIRSANANAVQALRLRRALYAGDIVATGASTKLTLLFQDGAQVRLRENTAVQIQSSTAARGKANLLRVLGGEIWARLRPGNVLETRTAALGVLGTEIRLVATEKSSTLDVIEGAVDFHNDFGAVTVGTNQQSIANEGQAPTKPLTIENAGLTVSWSFDLDHAVLPREQFYVSLNRQIVEKELQKRRTIATQSPNNPKAKRDLADALFDMGNYEESLAQYTEASILASNDPQLSGELAVRRGNVLLQLERPEEARTAFTLALGSAPAKTGTPQLTNASLETAPSPADAEDNQDEARAGMAWLELFNNRPQAALTWADTTPSKGVGATLANTALNAEATTVNDKIAPELLLARGVAALRAGQNEVATRSLRSLSQSTSRWRYQGLAWLALAQLDRGDTAAMPTAQKAVELEPDSGLARGNLALAYFFNNRLSEAGTQAKRAVELNPQSVAARVTLGQVDLARGEVASAEREAAQAVALDPMLPQGFYLLGVAQASRRDYSHARRSLNRSLELAPNFLPSASALAHVMVATGESKQAVTLLTDLLPRYPQSDEVLAALGLVSYEGASYKQAESYFRQATEKKPTNALYQSELARTLLYNNRLSEAIATGEAAVHLAPQLGQPRAILGLAYEFGGLRTQAERAYREALVRDPTNSLALSRLGDFADTRPGAAKRLAVGSDTQAFLFDPSLSRQLLRGGINSEVLPTTGSNSSRGLAVTQRVTANDGKLNAIGYYNNDRTDGVRQNADAKSSDTSAFVTYTPNSSSNFYATVRGTSTKNGLFGSDLAPSSDDRQTFGYGQAQFAMRRQTSSRGELWLGLFANRGNAWTRDPNMDSFIDSTSALPTSQQNFRSSALMPEARFDLRLGERSRGQRLSFGMAFADTSFNLRRDLQYPITGLAQRTADQRDRVATGYVQLMARPGARWQLSSQLRLQNLNRTGQSNLVLPGQNGVQSILSKNSTLLLPSLVASYASNSKTTLRLSLNRQTTDATTATFAPVDTLTSTEIGALPFGTPNALSVAQFDMERSIGNHGFVKAFAFASRADQLSIGGSDLLGLGLGLSAANAPVLNVANWRSHGVGLRVEQRLASGLYSNFSLVSRQTSNSSAGSLFNGGSAPYEPSLLATMGLNYIDSRGFKVGLSMRHNGSFFADVPGQITRGRFDAKTYFDLRLAREASARGEFFLQVRNVFDTPQLAFSGYRIGRRQLEIGFNRRF